MDQEETMRARLLTAAEALAFRAIRLEALADAPEAYGSTFADWADAPLEQYVARLEGSLVFGAFGGGNLAGIAAYDRERGGHVEHRAYVSAVYVSRDWRGQGVVDRLLAAVEAQGRAEGVLQLELHVACENLPAIGAYRRAGYVEAGVVPRAILCRGRFLDEQLMVRMLDGPDTRA